MQIEPALRALSDSSRLRVMRLVAQMELAVGEIAQVLGQSQPRVSQHVARLVDAGLVERRKEGNSVFLREAAPCPISDAVNRLLATAEREDAEFAEQSKSDRNRLATIRDAREKEADRYFARHADEWDTLREIHGPEKASEEALLAALAEASIGHLLDIGTGTGRITELLAPHASHIVALDKSLDMLRVARARLQAIAPDKVELAQGDFTNLPFSASSFDTVLLHQVLHFAHDPALALKEAARVTRPGGRIAVVDLARHELDELRTRHAHARLGFADATMAKLLAEAGFDPADPVEVPGRELTVKIWSATRIAHPAPKEREIA
ncbi:ArsR/SmtB family transcription factor [Aurantiacibacter sediminis]|uniref:Metalloregulator ArsR/SmtB family transcription factor n=1 Tax=Aurantiacibacter sediminis TaxID=2793064 RepID=A0ABS0N5C5_9SPHN|nr:metalloregulator ArsR/SmtB family transcription factor [Aurantiacibacter sediminis]MBH5323002.1 metalloregulator ArsR/SmtB family transcription factor [Aurantiacibacter sediminis]